uniref:Uncharacterized protein n=1 Tax=Solanum tuberosum TaxID=4113 RepID=M1A893_SOLTU
MFSSNSPSNTPTTSTTVKQLSKGVRGNGSIDSIPVILEAFVFPSLSIPLSTLGIEGGFWDIGVGNPKSSPSLASVYPAGALSS